MVYLRERWCPIMMNVVIIMLNIYILFGIAYPVVLLEIGVELRN